MRGFAPIALVLAALILAGCGAAQTTTSTTETTSPTSASTTSATTKRPARKHTHRKPRPLSEGSSPAALAYQRGRTECRYLRQTTHWSQQHAVQAIRGETISDMKVFAAEGCVMGYLASP
jgi:hypothetical protein